MARSARAHKQHSLSRSPTVIRVGELMIAGRLHLRRFELLENEGDTESAPNAVDMVVTGLHTSFPMQYYSVSLYTTLGYSRGPGKLYGFIRGS